MEGRGPGALSRRAVRGPAAVAFALLPELSLDDPHVIISGHGLAIWFTTPLVFYVLWRSARPLCEHDLLILADIRNRVGRHRL